MPDGKDQAGGHDPTRTNVREGFEVRRSSERFGVTPDALRVAVQAIGNEVAAEAHLKGIER